MKFACRHAVISLDRAVKVDLTITLMQGLPALVLMGASRKEMSDCRKKLYSAIKSSGFKLPKGRVTINCQWLDKPIFARHLLLSIAVRLIAGSKIDQHTVCLADLDLIGNLVPIRGAYVLARWAKENGFKRIIVASENCAEVGLVPELAVFAARDLNTAVQIINGRGSSKPTRLRLTCKSVNSVKAVEQFIALDLPWEVKLMVIVAMCSRENILLFGPPGVGKSLLVDTLVNLQPSLTEIELKEAACVQSLSGALVAKKLIGRPALKIGSDLNTKQLTGNCKQLGLLASAHKGLVVVDELAACRKTELNLIQQVMSTKLLPRVDPLQDKQVILPADLQFVAAANPCPCGYFGNIDKSCKCSSQQILNWQNQLTGALLERFAMIVDVNCVPKFDDKVYSLWQRIASSPINKLISETYAELLLLAKDHDKPVTNLTITELLECLNVDESVAIYLRTENSSLRRKAQVLRLAHCLTSLWGYDRILLPIFKIVQTGFHGGLLTKNF